MRTGDQYQTQSSSWRSLGLKGVKERCPLCVICCWSWCIPGPQPASKEPCPSPPSWYLESWDPHTPRENRLVPTANILNSHHAIVHQGKDTRLEDVSLPYWLLSVLSTMYFFPHSPTWSSPQAATLLYRSAAPSQVLLPQEMMLSHVWGHLVVVTLMGLLASSR